MAESLPEINVNGDTPWWASNEGSKTPASIVWPGKLSNMPVPPPATDNIGSDDLTFPHDLQNYRYHILFDFRKWQRRSVRDRTFFAAQGNLRLPVPQNMIDNTQVQWGIEGNNPIAGSLIDELARQNIAGATMPRTMEQFGDAAKNFVGNVDATGPGVGFVTQSLQSIFGPQNTGQTAAVFGLAVNPFLTVVFQSPLFKRHSFSWRLAPKTRAESETLVRIGAKFRQHMLPSLTNWAGGALLNYPDICLVTLYPADRYLYKFKPCVITDCVINYAPNTPAFKNDTSAPDSLIFTINLLEIEYWLKEDVDATWNNNSFPGGQTFVPTGVG